MKICNNCILLNNIEGREYNCAQYKNPRINGKEECKHFIDETKVNQWTKKSIEIGNSDGYLDDLHEVYPVSLKDEREIPKGIKKEIKKAYKKSNELKLFKKLLELDKFPIKDPYVAYFRKREDKIEGNPETIERITDRLFDKDLDRVLKGSKKPKEFNRRIGPLFEKWIRSLDYPFLSKDEFLDYEGIGFLDLSEERRKRFCNQELGLNVDKGVDLLAKANGNYIIGEGKFLTDYGGHQNSQLEDALARVREGKDNIYRIAILDGVVWIKKDVKMFRKVCNADGVVLSALLLEDFLNSF